MSEAEEAGRNFGLSGADLEDFIGAVESGGYSYEKAYKYVTDEDLFEKKLLQMEERDPDEDVPIEDIEFEIMQVIFK